MCAGLNWKKNRGKKADCFERGSETPESIKGQKFLNQLSDF